MRQDWTQGWNRSRCCHHRRSLGVVACASWQQEDFMNFVPSFPTDELGQGRDALFAGRRVLLGTPSRLHPISRPALTSSVQSDSQLAVLRFRPTSSSLQLGRTIAIFSMFVFCLGQKLQKSKALNICICQDRDILCDCLWLLLCTVRVQVEISNLVC